jgi:glycosyltransferase involved in cell wall biosynthesis
MVVDPPLYQGTMNRSGIIWKFLYSRLSASFMRAASKCDVCVVLNAYFAEEYLKRQDYYVMDCGVEPDILRNVTNENKKYWDKDGNIHMVFTGILHEHSGILRFIEMFQKLRVSGMILHVFGKGIYEEQIKCIADKNPAVRYHGFVSSDTIRSIQQQADILVCPNTIEHPINKVAFPSKIQEYMLSGVPVLATAVNGLTEEYYEYLYIYDDTVQGLEAVLKKIIADSTETRKNKAYSAREFILKEKTWDKQVGKLMSYLEKKHEENQSRQMH